MALESIEPGTFDSTARIRVVGIGSGGGNAVRHMIHSGMYGVEFICVDTDVQALNLSTAGRRVQLGDRLAKGLGADGNPAIGREAVLESTAAIKEALRDADMVFVVACMGGGTGTGAAPVIAGIAKELGALTVGVVTKPISFEGVKRKAAADSGIAELRRHVDCLITIPNDGLPAFASKKASFSETFKKANDALYSVVWGIFDITTVRGVLGVDFADVRLCMSNSGIARMGIGSGTGENRAREAAMQAITSPLLEDMPIDGAKGVLFTITSHPNIITNDEIQEIGYTIDDAVHHDANLFLQVFYDENAGDELCVTMIVMFPALPEEGAS